MKAILTDIQEKLDRGFYKNEEHVRLCIVSRVLKQCGWNIWDPSEVNAEFVVIPTEDRTKVDFALFTDPYTPSVFIEIKSVGKLGINLASVEKQLRDYNRNNTALFSIITDGNEWRLYYSQTGGEFSDKCFKVFRIQDGDLDDKEQSFYNFLNKTVLLSGESQRLAKEYLQLNKKQRVMEDSLSQAKRQILRDPFPSLPKALVALVKEKGFMISLDEALQYISKSSRPNIAVQPTFKPVLLPGSPPDTPPELVITIKWKVANILKDDEQITSHKAASAMVIAIRRLVEELGEDIIEQLQSVKVRGLPLILDEKTDSYHNQKPLGIKHYIVVVHSSNQDKIEIFKKVCNCLNLTDNFVLVRLNNQIYPFPP